VLHYRDFDYGTFAFNPRMTIHDVLEM